MNQAKAQGLTNADGSPISAAQIENAMRAANNSQYGEYASTGVVVPLNADTPNNAVYDTTGMKLVTDSTGNYLVQDPSMLATPSTALQDLITQSTGGASSPYSWGMSSAQAATPRVDPYGPFSPGYNTGDYSAGFGEHGRGLAPDYATTSVSVLSGSGTAAVSLYDGSTYLSGGVSMTNPSAVSYQPGFSSSVGYIYGASNAEDARNFLAGDGNQAFVSIPTPFGVNVFGAVTHAYGGSTALEVGIGTPGALSFGVLPWGHSTQTTEKTN
ncbi:polymorphic toxin type 22 domain-containing protein [Caballeronia concitans]|uniref:Bacterial toxin 22 domain-containing protein n=1 Tax=Caballeronia concitans TaxID=1777133 RepID=A0A658QV03_9BURK|nr:polymorphic toxin type 22 domain-containing protein [Caballeronia concitans]KIG10902.1 hypothetical protein BurMR1_2169 [Burkholderia sp. MR1]SAL24149.1 hypothetical protein AWB72_01832 [Caballeronia concitans]